MTNPTSAGIQARLKTAAERLLMSSGVAAASRRRLRNDALVLTYHNIVPDDAPRAPDAALHMPRSEFGEQLDLLTRTHDVVALDQAVNPIELRRRPVAAITFDDAYRGAMTLGMNEVRERGLSATVFVAPGFLNDGAFWWDELDWPAPTPEGERFRARALTECQGRDANVRALAATVGYRSVPVPPYARCIGEEELRAVARLGGLAIGAHTWSHINLAALDNESLTNELAMPLAWLRDRFDTAEPWIAYPYGAWSVRVVSAARGLGYALGVREDGGWLRRRRNTDALAVPRVPIVRGLTPEGFALRAAGMFCQ